MKNIILIVLTACFFSGCTIGPAFTPAPNADENESIVYLMRSHAKYGGMWWTNFYINDKEVVELYDEGYTWVHLKPGFYRFSAGSKMVSFYDVNFDLEIKPNETYYIEFVQGTSGNNQISNMLRVLPVSLASELIIDFSYKKSNYIN